MGRIGCNIGSDDDYVPRVIVQPNIEPGTAPAVSNAEAWTRHGSDAPEITVAEVAERRLTTLTNINRNLRQQNAELSAECGRLSAMLADRGIDPASK